MAAKDESGDSRPGRGRPAWLRLGGKGDQPTPAKRAARRSAATDPGTHMRPVVFTTRGTEASEGEGMRLTRLIGTPEFPMLDPFLLLDWFAANPEARGEAGFPNHPHRGIETVTYVVSGAVRHRDSRDRSGVVAAGGVQWMTAASGIVHSEIAEPSVDPLCGYQLWINLPAAEKRGEPGYQAFGPDTLPVETRKDVEVVVVAGVTSLGTRGAVADSPGDPIYLAVHIDPDGRFTEPLPNDNNVLVVVHDGSVRSFDSNERAVTIAAGTVAVFGWGDRVQLVAGPDGAEILLMAARPIGEPVARGGPIVMNTRAELRQAFKDYRDGKF